jgi:glycine/D-amino acid oxidase-like deaminating enzyme
VASPMRVLICGGGVIGASIAYFLSRRGVKAIIIERSGIACGASGKSGGFLALDWCDGTPLESLARRSFSLHASLPEEIGSDWGYRRLTTYGGFVGTCIRAPARATLDLNWLSDDVIVDRRLGSTDTTAQVHPGQFTAALIRAAEAHGAELRLGQVTGILHGSGEANVRGAKVDDDIVEADAVVIALGPWSVLAARWLPLPAVFGLKGHSIIFETGTMVPAEALFLEYQEPMGGGEQSPEIYPRSNGTTYVCAISSESPLPVDPSVVTPDPGAIERLHAMCVRLSPTLARAEILAQQACYRPVTQDGLPLIGPVSRLKGAYIATGHSVWGILNAPATGEAVAELIIDGVARTVDLSHFDPARFTPLDPKLLSVEAASQ